MKWKVKQWRDELLLTQEDVAEGAGVTRVTISDLERGLRDSQPATVHAVAWALAVTIPELEGGPYSVSERRLEEIRKSTSRWRAA